MFVFDTSYVPDNVAPRRTRPKQFLPIWPHVHLQVEKFANLKPVVVFGALVAPRVPPSAYLSLTTRSNAYISLLPLMATSDTHPTPAAWAFFSTGLLAEAPRGLAVSVPE